MQTIQELKEELQKLTDAVNEYAKHLEEKEKEKKCPIGVKEVGWIDTNEMLITFDTAQYGTEFEGWLEAYLTLRRFMQDKKGWDDLGGGLKYRPEFRSTENRFGLCNNGGFVCCPKWLYSDEETIRELMQEHVESLEKFKQFAEQQVLKN